MLSMLVTNLPDAPEALSIVLDILTVATLFNVLTVPFAAGYHAIARTWERESRSNNGRRTVPLKVSLLVRITFLYPQRQLS